jgi:uncharacterized membrane protein YczE
LNLEQMMAGGNHGRQEGIIFPILLPIIVAVVVVGLICGLGLTLLSVAAIDRLTTAFAALGVAVVIMALCTFIYVVGERKEQRA